ncbi:dihydrodipicolinate synthase family protein [Elongatibacter sediminis]|uniref:Dihydrodipicolinate synthase family protein n=1 Tax=Elongatibacter sediminis TaxID=3119006 RepID=A0AAW9R6Q0_9GAMM
MDRDSIDWRGYIPAITTPFDANGALDLNAERQLCRWLLNEGIHGMIALGTQGEWFSLSRGERRDMLRVVSEELKGHMTIIAGCNAFTAEEVSANAALAAEFGFDGVLVTPPPYVCPTEGEIYEFYRRVNELVTLPICVYNWPPGTHVNMSRALLERICELDRVVAIKNSTAGFDMNHYLDVFFSLNDRVRVFGMPTNDLGISLTLQHGADGTMGAGAVLGREYADYFEAIWDGDIDRARALGQRLDLVMSRLFNPDYTAKYGSTQGTFKALLNLQGLPGGHTRAPVMDLDEHGLEKVRETLAILDRLPAGSVQPARAVGAGVSA